MKFYDEEIKIKPASHGDGLTYSHESYGMISISRQTGGRELPLFGSEIGSNNTMSIKIEKADVTQNLGTNWYYGHELVCEVLMSPVQYAEMISNPNTPGIPCTIKYSQQHGQIKYRGIDITIKNMQYLVISSLNK